MRCHIRQAGAQAGGSTSLQQQGGRWTSAQAPACCHSSICRCAHLAARVCLSTLAPALAMLSCGDTPAQTTRRPTQAAGATPPSRRYTSLLPPLFERETVLETYSGEQAGVWGLVQPFPIGLDIRLRCVVARLPGGGLLVRVLVAFAFEKAGSRQFGGRRVAWLRSSLCGTSLKLLHPQHETNKHTPSTTHDSSPPPALLPAGAAAQPGGADRGDAGPGAGTGRAGGLHLHLLQLARALVRVCVCACSLRSGIHFLAAISSARALQGVETFHPPFTFPTHTANLAVA